MLILIIIDFQKNKFHLNKRNMLKVDSGWKSLKTMSYQVPPEEYPEILRRQAVMQLWLVFLPCFEDFLEEFY